MRRSDSATSFPWLAGTALGLAGATLASAPVWGQQPFSPALRSSGMRSVQDLSPRLFDELDQPRYRERQSHRGFEAINNSITVVAETSAADARRVLAEAERAWQEAGRVADRFARDHRREMFGLAAVQIVVERDPPRERDLPRTTVDVVGLKSNIRLYAGPGQASLESQLPELHQAVAWTLFHHAEYDTQLPDWVCRGLAGQVGQQLARDTQQAGGQASTAGSSAEPVVNGGDSLARLGGDQWRRRRAEADRLEQPAEAREEAAARVQFLLEAGDGAYAWLTLAQLAQSCGESAGQRRPDLALNTRQGEVQPETASGRMDQLLAELAPVYEQWRKAPQADQPVLPALDENPEVAAVQRDLAVALKLAGRGVAGAEGGGGKVKVVSLQPPAAAPAEDKPQAKQLPLRRSPAEIVRASEAGDHFWATLDGDGRLLLSTDARARELLGEQGLRFRRVLHEGRDQLVGRLPDGRELAGWLEVNPDDAARPLVKFAVGGVQQAQAQATSTVR